MLTNTMKLSVLLVAVILLISMQPANANLTYSYQAGAFGDRKSIGNLGIRAEIRTHIYRVNHLEQDGFWIGEHLINGAFIQFGYTLQHAGTYCSSGEVTGTNLTCPAGHTETVNGSQPVWFWQYWPEPAVYRFYYELGSEGLDWTNGTWHSYAFMPSLGGVWSFLIDDIQVSTASFTAVSSIEQATFAAEKVSNLTTPGPLGPVEFRNLSYLKQDGWHSVTTLYAIVYCATKSKCPPVAYGVASDGPNHIIAGTSIPRPHIGQWLWSSGTQVSTSETQVSTNGDDHSINSFYMSSIAVFTLAVFIIAIIQLRKKKRQLQKTLTSEWVR